MISQLIKNSQTQFHNNKSAETLSQSLIAMKQLSDKFVDYKDKINSQIDELSSREIM